MTFKEFLVQQDHSMKPKFPSLEPYKNMLKQPETLKMPKKTRGISPNSSKVFNVPIPDDPIKFLKRGAGFAKTTGNGYQI